MRSSRAVKKVQLAVIANPNSPSGTTLSPERIVELAEELPCPLLVDEAYADFSDENCIRLVAENERIMVARSLSKSYALAGMRFGFLVAQESIVERLLCVKDSYNCDTLSIVGATAAITDPAEAVRSYHAALQKLDIAPYRAIDEDLMQTMRQSAYGSSSKTSVATSIARNSGKSGATESSDTESPDFANMTAQEKLAWNRRRLDHMLGD